MNIKGIQCGDVNWTHLAKDKEEWWTREALCSIKSRELQEYPNEY